MDEITSANGQEFRNMFAAAVNWMEKSVPEIDALNVFPVPDGDTGTNMLLTMRSSMEEAYRAPDHSTESVAEAMATGALMGARGNSGVILSQIISGMAIGLKGKKNISGKEFAVALKQASKTAYNGVSNPVEGTILTVVKDAAQAAETQAKGELDDMAHVLEAAVHAAAKSVSNTPNLLPILKETGVVDAGGQGLYTILEGALNYVKGEVDQMQFRKPQMISSSLPLTAKTPHKAADEVPYGYCTELLIKGKGLNTKKIRKHLNKKGESLIVVGDESTVRVHVHTLEPGEIIKYATNLGTMHQVSIRNMDEQYADFWETRKEKIPASDVAIIAVVSGDGMSEVFKSLGVAAIVSGGQSMNPSAKELLQAIENSPSDKAIILPNNRNIIMTAQQVVTLTNKKVAVVPTETLPQGVAATLAFDYEADFETNVGIMTKAKKDVHSIEITRAVRSTRLGGLEIKKKQPIGFLDGDMVSVGNDITEVLLEVLSRLNPDESQVITIYYGADTKVKNAEKTSAAVQEKYPGVQIEIVRGGQPHYDFIVSVE